MEIRKRLTYQFTAIVALLLLFSFISIYFSFSESRQEEFYERLGSKAKLVAQMLVEIDEIDTVLLGKIERNNPLSLPNEIIIIYDNLNEQIYNTDREHIFNISEAQINAVRLRGELEISEGPFEILGYFHTGQFDHIVVFVSAEDIFGMSKLRRLRLIIAIVYFSSLIVVYFSGRLFSARALQPISTMVTRVNGISVANLNERLDGADGKDELARLARTFNRMLKRLENSFIAQRSFINNASHELRTPLTIITGQLEVVLLSARSNEQYRDTVISVLDDIRNLNILSNRLLMLAQTSSEKSDIHFAEIRVDDILWKARKQVIKRNPKNIIAISFSDSIDDDMKLTIQGNEVLLQTALVNLMDNGCKYSNDHRVEVSINFNSPEKLIFTFSDRGYGIPENELNLIFQPFYRAGNSLKTQGLGIGLSLVESIIKMHQGNVDVKSVVDEGSVFTLVLPSLFRIVPKSF